MTELIAKPYSSQAEQDLDQFDKTTPDQVLDATADKDLPDGEVSWKKRHGDVRRSEQRLQAEVDELKLQMAATSKRAPLRSDDELAAIKEENPEMYKTIEEISSRANEDVRAQMNALVEDRDRLKTKSEQSDARSILTAAHPDHGDISTSDAWMEWVDSKPEFIKSAIYDKAPSDGELAVSFFTQFKAETGYGKKGAPSQQSKQRDAAQAVGKGSSVDAPAGGNNKVWKESEIHALTAHEWTKYEQDIMLAIQPGSGRYDPHN